MERFEGDDDGYLRWIEQNPGGYVLNVQRTHAPYGLTLHRANCYAIQAEGLRGQGWTTGFYVKVCASRKQSLDAWASRDVGSMPNRCSKCRA